MRGNGFCGSIGWVGRISALGSRLLLSSEYNRVATPSCLRLFTQTMLQALALALTTAGSSRPARMAMMAITTSNSIRVNAWFEKRPPRFISRVAPMNVGDGAVARASRPRWRGDGRDARPTTWRFLGGSLNLPGGEGRGEGANSRFRHSLWDFIEKIWNLIAVLEWSFLVLLQVLLQAFARARYP